MFEKIIVRYDSSDDSDHSSDDEENTTPEMFGS